MGTRFFALFERYWELGIGGQAFEVGEGVEDVVFTGIETATDPVAGGMNASWGYQSGLMVGVYRFGAGEFILNSLLIRDNLGQVPQAERLLRNMFRFAARDAANPLAPLPADFDAQLKAAGY